MCKLLMKSMIILFVSLIISLQAQAAVPVVDGKGLPAATTCPTPTNVESIFHSDKIVFTITSVLQAALIADQAKLNALPLNTELDIKVKDDPTKVAYIKGKVLTFLGAATTPGNIAAIKIISVTYAAAVCLPQI